MATKATTKKKVAAPKPKAEPKPVGISAIAQDFVAIADEISVLESRVETLKEKKKGLSEQLVGMFTDEAVEKLTVSDAANTRRTLYIHTSVYAKLKEGLEREHGLEALRLSKLQGFIAEQWNTQTLSAWVREQQRNGEAIPDPMQKVFTFDPKHEIRVNRS